MGGNIDEAKLAIISLENRLAAVEGQISSLSNSTSTLHLNVKPNLLPFSVDELEVEIKLIDENLRGIPLPCYASTDAAAIDLRANLQNQSSIVVKPGETVLVGTGYAIYIKDPKLVGLIVPRSGLGHKYGIVLGNGTGVIDADYQGELKISVWNRSNEPYEIRHLDRIAQYMIVPVVRPTFKLVSEFSDETERGEGGFGHSGNQ